MIDQSEDTDGGMELNETRQVVAWAHRWWKARRKLGQFVLANLEQAARRMNGDMTPNTKPSVPSQGPSAAFEPQPPLVWRSPKTQVPVYWTLCGGAEGA